MPLCLRNGCFKKMITEIRKIERMLGTGIKECLESEKNTKIFRKNI